MNPPDAAMLSPALVETLIAVADAMAPAEAPWWIIASAAVALHGASPVTVADVDVLIGMADAPRILPRIGLEATPGAGTDRFRSAIFATWRDAPLAVEFMADFHYRRGDAWHRVCPVTREPRRVGCATVFVPARAELVSMLQGFGRPKDLARAALLNGPG